MRGEDDSTTRATRLQGPANVDDNNTTLLASSVTTTITTATPVVVVAAATAAVGGAVGAHLPVLATGGEADSRTVIIPSAAAGGSNVNHSAGKAGVLQSGAVGGSGSVNGTNSTTSTATSNMEQAEEFVKPIFKDGEIILEVECGQNKAAMYLSKLCQGSKGPCISFQGSWLTPNEFQFVSGRETAKDWKRSIRHHGKSLKLLLAKGILSVHPTMCDCEGCRIGAVLTRKGEKRRIPNGERKRKSTGNAPENSGSGAFRAVGNLAKTQDSIVLDPKRVVVEKFVEASQSPLKESSLLNLPEMKSDASICLGAQSVVSDASKVLPDVGLNTPSLPSAAPPERLADINGNTPPASIGCPKDSVESSSRLLASDKQKTNEGQRHSSNSSSNSNDSTTSAQNSNGVADSAVVAATSDVRVLSSSGGATVTSVDKSLSRLALHQAAAATMKTPEEASSDKAAAGPLPPSVAKTDIVNKEERLSGEPRREKLSDSASKTSSRKESKEGLGSGEVKMKLDKSASSLPPASAVVGDREPSGEPKEKDNENKVAKIAAEHSAGLHRPRDQCSSKTTPPVSTTSTSTSTSTATVTTHKSTQSRDSGRDDTKHRHNTSSTLSSSSFSSAVTSATLPEAVRPAEKGEHYTMKHSTGEHRSDEKFAPHKHAAGKSADHHQHHHHHHHHHVASSDKKERRAEVASGTAPDKDRHVSRDKESSSSSSSRHGDRESERRKHEDKVLEKERSRLATCGSGGGSSSGGKSAFSAEKHDPIPAQEFPAGALVRSDGSAEAAAFSDYMRVLAAGHHGLMPPPTACLPPMFPVRAPDVTVNTGLLHPMHACSMFSTPGALMPKDSVMYPTSAGALSSPYGTPSVTQLHVMPPHQFPTAAATTSVLDYSRSYPYPLPWASGLPFIVPDAMSAAAAAAANSAGAAAAAKRSRDEVDSAVDLSSKRLRLDQQLSAAGYGHALSMAPMDYMATFRGLPSMSCGMESNLYDKSAADYMRKRLYPEMPTASASGSLKGLDSHYLSSLPDYYRALYCCGCMENRPEDVRTWSVEDVVKFVSALDGCSVYAEIFREQRVDGKILVLLTTDHLMKSLGMKLGPAILLTQRVAKILQEATRASGCDMCKRLASMVPALHSVGY